MTGWTTSYGVGLRDYLLVMQPSDGVGSTGTSVGVTQATQILTEVDHTGIERTHTLIVGDEAVADVSQAASATIVLTNASPSQTPSPTASQTASQTPSQTRSPSNTPTQTPSPSSTCVYVGVYVSVRVRVFLCLCACMCSHNNL
jgi:hypothetical protein